MDTQTKPPTSATERTALTLLGKKLLEVRQKIIASGRPLVGLGGHR
jgi:hypothetical protein